MSRETPPNFVAHLRASRLFTHINVQEAETLLGWTRQRVLHDREVLFRQGSACGEVYLLMGGMLKLYRDSGAVEHKIVGFVYPGDVFCLEAMFSGDGHPFTAEAIEHCWLAGFERASFLRFLQSRADYQQRLLRELSRNSSRWLQRVERVEQLSAEQRLITFLIERIDEAGHASCASHVPRRRVDLANYLGMKPETLSRELKKLRDRGIISADTGPISVTDPDSLRALCRLSEQAGPVGRIQRDRASGQT